MNNIDEQINIINQKLDDIVTALQDDTILWGDAAFLEERLTNEKKSLLKLKLSRGGSICGDMCENRTIQLKNISKSATEIRIRRAFDIFGEVETVVVKHAGACSYALVTFASLETAEEVVGAIKSGELRIPIGISGIQIC